MFVASYFSIHCGAAAFSGLVAVFCFFVGRSSMTSFVKASFTNRESPETAARFPIDFS